MTAPARRPSVVDRVAKLLATASLVVGAVVLATLIVYGTTKAPGLGFVVVFLLLVHVEANLTEEIAKVRNELAWLRQERMGGGDQ